MYPHPLANPVHDVLRNPSLASEILSFVTSCPEAEQAKPPLLPVPRNLSTCLAMALTSKHLLEPALDELWRVLDDLLPLIQLIPGLEHTNNKIFTDKVITRSSLNRLQYHARRVRSLDIFSGRAPASLSWGEPSLFAQLLILLRGEPLLPCLTYLSIKGFYRLHEVTLMSSILPLLPCSTLRNIFLQPVFQDEQPPTGPVANFDTSFAAMPPTCHFLNVMATRTNQSVKTLVLLPPVMARITGLIRQFKKLKTIIALGGDRAMDLSSVHNIFALEDLDSLQLMVSSSHNWKNLASPIVSRSITRLLLNANSRSATNFMTSFKCPHLKTVILDIFEDGAALPWQESWDELVNRITQDLPNLEELMVSLEDPKIPTLSCSSLSPVFQLGQLRRLHLVGVTIYPLSHDEIKKMCQSLPLLHHLRIDFPEMDHMSLLLLIEARMHILNLQYISIPMDWRGASVQMLPDIPASTPKHPLATLYIFRVLRDIMEARNQDLRNFARFLFPLFPDVSVVVSPSLAEAGGTVERCMEHYMAEEKAMAEPESESDSDDDKDDEYYKELYEKEERAFWDLHVRLNSDGEEVDGYEGC